MCVIRSEKGNILGIIAFYWRAQRQVAQVEGERKKGGLEGFWWESGDQEVEGYMSEMQSITGSTQHPSMSSCFSSPILPHISTRLHRILLTAPLHPSSLRPPRMMPTDGIACSLLMTLSPHTPPPLISTPLSSPRLGERKPGSGGINHCYRKREEKSVILPYLAV